MISLAFYRKILGWLKFASGLAIIFAACTHVFSKVHEPDVLYIWSIISWSAVYTLAYAWDSAERCFQTFRTQNPSWVIGIAGATVIASAVINHGDQCIFAIAYWTITFVALWLGSRLGNRQYWSKEPVRSIDQLQLLAEQIIEDAFPNEHRYDPWNDARRQQHSDLLRKRSSAAKLLRWHIKYGRNSKPVVADMILVGQFMENLLIREHPEEVANVRLALDRLSALQLPPRYMARPWGKTPDPIPYQA